MSRIDLQGTPGQVDRASVQRGAAKALLGKRPAELEAWVDSHVTDLASAKQLLKQLTLVVAALAKREFRA